MSSEAPGGPAVSPTASPRPQSPAAGTPTAGKGPAPPPGVIPPGKGKDGKGKDGWKGKGPDGKGKGKGGPPGYPPGYAPPGMAVKSAVPPADPNSERLNQLQSQFTQLEEEWAASREEPLDGPRPLAEQRDEMLALFVDKLQLVYDRVGEKELGRPRKRGEGISRERVYAELDKDPDVVWQRQIAARQQIPVPDAELHTLVLRKLMPQHLGLDAAAYRAICSSKLTLQEFREIIASCWEENKSPYAHAVRRMEQIYEDAAARYSAQRPMAQITRGMLHEAVRSDGESRNAALEGVGFLRLCVMLQDGDPQNAIDWRELKELLHVAFSEAGRMLPPEYRNDDVQPQQQIRGAAPTNSPQRGPYRGYHDTAARRSPAGLV